MKRLLITVTLVVSVLVSLGQNLVFDSTRLINNVLWNFYHDNRKQVYQIYGGQFQPTQTPQGAIVYYPATGSYFGQSSGTGVTALGESNIAVGDHALDSSNSIDTKHNIAFGLHALMSLKNGQDNTVFGWDAMMEALLAKGNFAAIEDALHLAQYARDCIAIGRGALYSHPSPINNISLGYQSAYYMEEGTENTGVGAYTLNFIKRGYNNTAVGAYALEANDTSKTVNNSIGIGHSAGITSPYSNILVIGYNANVPGANRMNIVDAILGEGIYQYNPKVIINGRFEVKTGDITINGVHYNAPSSYPQGVKSHPVNDGFGNITWEADQTTTPLKSGDRLAAYLPDGRLIYLVKVK